MFHKMNAQVSLAYDYILERILSYDLLPDAKVSDNQLAKELGISRAPIREAILLLVMDGLIHSTPDGKMIVAPIHFDDITDILNVRSALEITAVRIISENGWLSEEQHAELHRLHHLFSESNVRRAFSQHYSYDDLFHSTLISFAGSKRISEITAQMRLQMQRIRWLSLLENDRQSAAVYEHRAILDAIQNKDLNRAISCMQEHFNQSEQAFRRVFDDRNVRQIVLAVSSLILNEQSN